MRMTAMLRDQVVKCGSYFWTLIYYICCTRACRQPNICECDKTSFCTYLEDITFNYSGPHHFTAMIKNVFRICRMSFAGWQSPLSKSDEVVGEVHGVSDLFVIQCCCFTLYGEPLRIHANEVALNDPHWYTSIQYKLDEDKAGTSCSDPPSYAYVNVHV